MAVKIVVIGTGYLELMHGLIRADSTTDIVIFADDPNSTVPTSVRYPDYDNILQIERAKIEIPTPFFNPWLKQYFRGPIVRKLNVYKPVIKLRHNSSPDRRRMKMKTYVKQLKRKYGKS